MQRNKEGATVITLDDLIEFVEEIEKMNGGDPAKCWLSWKMSLDVLRQEASQPSPQEQLAADFWKRRKVFRR
jgi:hypothetical protein